MKILPLALRDLYYLYLMQEEELEEEEDYEDDDDGVEMEAYYFGLEEEEEPMGETFGVRKKEFSVKEAMPPNKTWVVCLLIDKVSGKKRIRSSFCEDGVFWDSSSSKAEGIETAAKNYKGNVEYDWNVESWMLADE